VSQHFGSWGKRLFVFTHKLDERLKNACPFLFGAWIGREMTEARTETTGKLDWFVVVISMYLTFFINEFYKVRFQWEADLVAFTIGTALVPTAFCCLFLVFCYRKIVKNLFWSYLVVMIAAGFMGDGVRTFNAAREMGMTIGQASKAMGIATTVLTILSCAIYGIVSGIIYVLQNITKK